MPFPTSIPAEHTSLSPQVKSLGGIKWVKPVLYKPPSAPKPPSVPKHRAAVTEFGSEGTLELLCHGQGTVGCR